MSMIPVGITKTLFRAALVVKKNAPNLLFAGGIAGVAGGTVMACRATLKLSEELPKMKQDLEAVRENIDDPEEQKRALALVYGMNVSKVVKLYAPPVIVLGASVGALTGSHVQLTRRNAGMTAAYAALAKVHDEYRARVKADIGEDKEYEIHRAITTEKVDLPNGKKEKIKVVGNGGSGYARFFDEGSRDFKKNAEMNRIFIKCQQAYANELLHSRGHVFLNEVYDALGFERTPEGSVVGWVHPTEDGDGFVDFGMYESRNDRFVQGLERVCHLDFNVDGLIWDKI